jgi:hypothetical protein
MNPRTRRLRRLRRQQARFARRYGPLEAFLVWAGGIAYKEAGKPWRL